MIRLRALAFTLAMSCIASLAFPAIAAAQAARPPSGIPGGRFEISGGAGMIGGTNLGTATATLSGSGAPTGTAVTFFDTETKIESGPRYEARLAWRFTPALQVEGGVAINQTKLTTRITNDFEQAPDTEASETFNEFAMEAGLLFRVTKLSFADGRARLFVAGGAGYLRQVHEGRTVIETGGSAYAGGGVTVTLREAPRNAFVEGLGLRADVRANFRSGGFEQSDDSGMTVAPSVTGGLFIRF